MKTRNVFFRKIQISDSCCGGSEKGPYSVHEIREAYDKAIKYLDASIARYEKKNDATAYDKSYFDELIAIDDIVYIAVRVVFSARQNLRLVVSV